MSVAACSRHQQTELQNKIKSVSKITIDSLVEIELNEPFIKPVFGVGDSTVFLTKEGYKGIYKYSIGSNVIDTVTNVQGAGYNYLIDSTFVFYTANEFSPSSGRSSYIFEYNVNNKKTKTVYTSAQRINNLYLVSSRVLSFFENDSIKYFDVRSGHIINQNFISAEVFRIRGGDIENYTGYKKTVYQISKNNIVSVEKINNDSILVNAAEEGLYLYNPYNNTKELLGDFNFPKWNNFYKIFVFTSEINDGHKIISGNLFLSNLSRSINFPLSDSLNTLYENPSWSNDGKKLVFNTFQGAIKIVYLSYN